MKAFVVFSVVLAVALGAEDYCYQNVVEACKTTNKKCKFFNWQYSDYYLSKNNIGNSFATNTCIYEFYFVCHISKK